MSSCRKHRGRSLRALIVAVVSYAFFELAGVVYYLLAGVLAGNVWEAWRRTHRRTSYTFPRGLGTFLREISPWREGKQLPTRAALTERRYSKRAGR